MVGKLIVYEGIDGCGKDTQINLMNNKLKELGYDTIVLSNVSESPIGKTIREILSNKEYYISSMQMACLFLSELFIVDKQIKEHLDNGKTVIMSRWFYSTLAYAGDKLADYLTIKDISTRLICKPNYLIYLNIDPDISMERITKRDSTTDKKLELYENTTRLTRIHKKYESVLDMISFEMKHTTIIKVDASKNIEDVFNDIYIRLE
jgi:dTMP kinase